MEEVKGILKRHLLALKSGEISDLDNLISEISNLKDISPEGISDNDRKEILRLIGEILREGEELQSSILEKLNVLSSSQRALKVYNQKL